VIVSTASRYSAVCATHDEVSRLYESRVGGVKLHRVNTVTSRVTANPPGQLGNQSW
jgi:hypothetical protein